MLVQQNLESIGNGARPMQFDQIAFGRDFYDRGMEELNKGLHAETMAKVAYLAAATAGLNVVYVGPPGGGKSVLLFEAPRLFGEAGEHDIKRIPPQSDLTGKQVTGGKVMTVKEIEYAGVKTTETVTNTIEPILHKDVRIIVGDEINRASPLAVGAMLEGLESGRVITNEGIVNLKNFMFAAVAINPPGADKSVFDLGAAFKSRMAIGSRVGEDTNGVAELALKKKLSSPSEMQQIVSYEELEILQSISANMSIPGDIIPKASMIIEALQAGLAEEKIVEAVGRMAVQITGVASALATLRGSRHVELEDIVQATRFGAESRLGTSSRTSAEVDNFFEKKIVDVAGISDKDLQWNRP